jgi:hypothetical protein
MKGSYPFLETSLVPGQSHSVARFQSRYVASLALEAIPTHSECSWGFLDGMGMTKTGLNSSRDDSVARKDSIAFEVGDRFSPTPLVYPFRSSYQTPTWSPRKNHDVCTYRVERTG